MADLCEETRALAADLVRPAGSPEQREARRRLEEHALACEVCARVLAGARALDRELATWAVPEPSAGLAARTLARVRLAEALAPKESGRLPATPAAPAAPIVQASLRRKSVELLATWALPGPRPPEVAMRGRTERLGLRLAIQAAAAVLIFCTVTAFTVRFYPVFVEALEESRTQACQARLGKLSRAIERYRHDHPEQARQDEPLHGRALRDVLLAGGYAREEDFVCPAVRGAPPGALSYFLRLPDERPGRHVTAWDKFGNHGGSGVNVVDGSGRPELLEGEGLWKWIEETRSR